MKNQVPMTDNVEAVKAEEAAKTEAAAQAPEAKAEEPAKNPLEKSVEITIDQDKLKDGVKAELKRIGKTAKMPGFRPGHVPAKMIEAAYGFEANNRVLNRLIDEGYRAAVAKEGFQVVGQASAEPVEGEGMKFRLTFETMPEIKTPDFSGVELKRYTCPVTDEAVQKTIDIIVKQRATYEAEDGRKAAAEDKVTVDFAGSIDDKAFEGGSAQGFQFVLAQGRMLPEFEAAVTGMAAGESKSFDLTFPANYGNAELAGKKATFKVDCKKVEKPVYPEVNEEFAKSLGIDSVEKMRAEIKSNLEREVKARLENRTRGEVFEAVYKLCDFPIPQVMLRDEMMRIAENTLRASGIKDKKPEDLPQDLLREPAQRQVRLSLMLAHIVGENKIGASREEVEARAREIASAYQQPEEMVKWLMGQQEQANRVAEGVIEAKLVDFVLGKAKTTDEAIAFDQLMGNEAAAA